MKRSEMLEIIVTTLNDIMDGYNNTLEQDAEILLHAIENAGISYHEQED